MNHLIKKHHQHQHHQQNRPKRPNPKKKKAAALALALALALAVAVAAANHCVMMKMETVFDQDDPFLSETSYSARDYFPLWAQKMKQKELIFIQNLTFNC